MHEILKQMDGTRKCQPEWDNPIPKEHKWYALTNKRVLAQNLKINKLQFSKLKKKEDLSEGAWFP